MNENINFRTLDQQTCNLYLPSVKPDHAFFRLGKNMIILTDGCRRFDFKIRGMCVNATDFYECDYLASVSWLGPFTCLIDGRDFVAKDDFTINGEYGSFEFTTGEVVATIDEDYYWIESSIYGDYSNFMKSLM